MIIPPKTISQIADEFDAPHKTFRNHIKSDDFLKVRIKKGLQMPLQQKCIYDTFGYPPGANKADYDGVE